MPSCDGVCPARSALDGAATSARRRRSSSTKALRVVDAAWSVMYCARAVRVVRLVVCTHPMPMRTRSAVSVKKVLT